MLTGIGPVGQGRALVLGSSFMNSFFPFLVAVLGLSGAPFFYGAWFKFGSALGFVVWMCALWRRRSLDGVPWWNWVRGTVGWRFWVMSLGHFDVVFTVAAAAFLDMSLVVVILQLGPLCFVWIAWSTDLGRGGYRRPGVGMVFAGLLAGVGAAMCLSAEGGAPVWELSWRSWAGAGLALTGTVAGGCNAVALPLSRDLARCTGAPVLLSSAVGAFLSALCVSGLLGVLAFALPGEYAHGSLPWFLGFALLVMPLSGLMWRRANLGTRELGVNILGYFLPVFSVSWLALAGLVELRSVWLFVAGLGLVLVANLSLAARVSRE